MLQVFSNRLNNKRLKKETIFKWKRNSNILNEIHICNHVDFFFYAGAPPTLAWNSWSFMDSSVNFLPIRSWTSRYLATHLSIQTDSPFSNSASLYFGGMHYSFFNISFIHVHIQRLLLKIEFLNVCTIWKISTPQISHLQHPQLPHFYFALNIV